LELIIVDDGSTDGTAAVVRAFTDPRIRYVHQGNAGPSAARNAGAARATGEWVAVLDSDDWWAPRKLEAQLARAAEVPDAAVIYTSVAVVNAAGEVFGEHPATEEGRVLDTLLQRNIAINSSTMIRRDVLARVGCWDESIKYGEDWDLWLRIAAEHPFAKVDEALTYSLRRAGSQGSHPDRMRDSCLSVLERAFATYARDRRHLRRRALAGVHYGAAIQNHDQRRRTAAARDLLRTLRLHPLHGLALRRLVRLALSV
jgi:glycosyltransferase involved in cell wall biosynthesis